jgi:hypothetical protein
MEKLIFYQIPPGRPLASTGLGATPRERVRIGARGACDVNLTDAGTRPSRGCERVEGARTRVTLIFSWKTLFPLLECQIFRPPRGQAGLAVVVTSQTDARARAMAAWGALLEDDDASPTTTASVLTALASASDLRVPASVLRGDGWEDSVACRRRYVEDLYAREPSILLERHGHLVPRSRLLAAFGHLEGSSYECDFHLNRLKEGATTTTGGTGTGTGTTTATARNRRLAHMRSSLEPAGYFHEDALRRREPLLFETFVGAPPRADSNSNSNLNLNSTATATATATDGAGASHAVSLAMLEREDERAAAALLSRQRAALRERERVEDMDAEDEPPLEDEPPPPAATDATSRPGVVVEAVGPGGRRGASGRATADQLRRAAVEGWARGNDDDDDADANRRLGGCEPSSCGTGTTREINRSAIASVVADPERDAKLAAFARTMRERYLGAFFTSLHWFPYDRVRVVNFIP